MPPPIRRSATRRPGIQKGGAQSLRPSRDGTLNPWVHEHLTFRTTSPGLSSAASAPGSQALADCARQAALAGGRVTVGSTKTHLDHD
jgi:hypothetical protein